MRERPLTRRATLLGAALAVLATAADDARQHAGTHPDLPDELRLATGPPGAVYRVVGSALAEALESRLGRTRVRTVPSRASTDNLALLHAGEVDMGLSSLDAALVADGEPPSRLSALGRIYDSHLHLVALADSPIRELADLAGRRVSFGARDSGTEFTCRRLVELAGVELDDVRMDQAESAHALRTGQIDAAFSLTGIPTPAIEDLASRQPVRVVALEEATELLADAYPGPYAPATVPATAYPGVASVPTVAVPNVLLARAGLAEYIAHLVTATVFGEAETIGAARPEASQINVRTGIATGPIPLHPGTMTWFREHKR